MKTLVLAAAAALTLLSVEKERLLLRPRQ